MVIILVAAILPASVASVASCIGIVTISFGKANLQIRIFLYPESKITLNNILLVNELIVFVLAIVAGICNKLLHLPILKSIEVL